MSRPTVRWLVDPDPDPDPDPVTVKQVHTVVDAVVSLGGAVGWLETPTVKQIEEWLGEWSRRTRAGFVLIEVDGRVQAMGGWQAGPEGPVGHVAELTKVMVDPRARGLGLGRLVVQTLATAAEEHGAELLTLGVRGNNHAAISLYETLGFSIWGVLPNAVAVGDYRFDDVRMVRPLRQPAGVIIYGSRPGGPGGSAAPSTTA